MCGADSAYGNYARVRRENVESLGIVATHIHRIDGGLPPAATAVAHEAEILRHGYPANAVFDLNPNVSVPERLIYSMIVSAMLRHRVLPTLAVTGFAIRFVLLVSGFACVPHADGMMMVPPESPGNDMAIGADAGIISGVGIASGTRPVGEDEPCDAPMPPGDCHASAPCAMAVVVTHRSAGQRGMLPAPKQVLLIVLAPRSRTTQPATPPPKA